MPHHPAVPRAPQPTREIFDPFNSSSTGHQRAENRLSGSTSWRESRSYKLAHQFRDTSGRGGTSHLSDLVGAGSVNWKKDGRKENGDWEKDAPGLRQPGWQDIRGMMSGHRKRSSEEIEETPRIEKKRRIDNGDKGDDAQVNSIGVATVTDNKSSPNSSHTVKVPEPRSPLAKQLPQIFRGLTIYLNGSTAPEISDYKLKQLFMQHGGNSSIALGRRTVTHVILGKTCGGGLASGKINKENTTISGKGIKYVTAQWVVDSVEKGIRQRESRYVPPQTSKRIGGSGQGSVRTMFTTMSTSKETG